MPPMLRALSYRNYRLYFTGQVISLAGTWMQQIAMSWLAYRLSGSSLVLGIVAFAGQIPMLLLAPFGGVLSDHFDRRRILLITQSLALCQALLLAAMTWSAQIQPWHLASLALLLGVINAMDVPARQSLAVLLVDDRNDLSNAIALNAFTMNSARLIGPSIAGVAVASLGEAVCFLVNALSYLALISGLLAMRLRPEQRTTPRLSAAQALREGFRYAFGTPWIRYILFLVANLSFFITAYATLMPAVTDQVFHGDAHTYGFLMACAGAGALVSTIYLAWRQGAAGLERVVRWNAPVTGLALMLFALSSELWIAAPILFVIGFGMIAAVASANTRIQTGVRNELRGRVLALFSTAFLGMAPLGSLCAGSLASVLGNGPTLLLCGLCSCLLSLYLGQRGQGAEQHSQEQTHA